MSFNENFEKYLNKVKRIQEQLNDFAEEQTKNALVMPLFSILGYDVFDTSEFMPEFTCDVATKKGEKVDYAILKDGEPLMIIEAKRAGMKLQKQQQGQLFRYFSTNRCRIAILTNGIVYQFFSDLNTPNVMDDEPFLAFNILEDDSSIYIQSLKQFHKEKFDIKNVISKAIYQKYAKVVEMTLKQDLITPSDEIVKYFLSRPEVKTGNRITAQMISKYRDVTQKAMMKVLGAKIQNIVPEITNVETSDVSEDSENIKIHNKLSNQSLFEKIHNIFQNTIPDYTYNQEDTDEFSKIHIYTTQNRKLGIVKILKSDNSMQFKKTGSTYFDVNTIDDIKNYIE